MDAVEYSIGVNNRFGLLLSDEEDPETTFKESEKAAKETKDKKAKSARPSVKDGKPQQTKKDKEAVNEESKKDAKRGNRGPKDVRRENEKNTRLLNGPNDKSREDRENVPPRKGGFNRSREDGGQEGGDSPVKVEQGGDRGGFGSRGGNRGARGTGGRGRGGFGANRGGRKREFERRSGSDRSVPEGPSVANMRSVKPQDKREGGGQFNWGNPADTEEEGVAYNQEKPDVEGSPEPGSPKPDAEEGQEQNEEGDAEKEEEQKEMSLEEWKELQNKTRAKMSFELRKPGEGEKKNQWKNTQVLQKEEISDEHGVMYEEKIKTSGRVKKAVPGIQFDFVNTEPKGDSRGGGRGGRGGRPGRGGRGGRGASGGRGRGGGRGGFGGGAGPQGEGHFEINSDEFPSLA
ncbi:LOW QUALITY PROTEIN: plasminogen activator inhibitor 1 RNA-binding protein [Nematostella vectensis]|uniref:LOW QUALITY PROTEIN: plasminogen activator inhibitor 1 RNA-binding protein n=1 Tax=Nematostella vectensis TaxID=45351 RepID=UPI0020776D84|nr:LOW QUALITY PROTEIN: plasminogen activator inhibitor 1 RNA-binding protein [Nematostella vectensis]